MKQQGLLVSREGYTLLEVIAALVIFGVLAALVVPRIIQLDSNTMQKAIDVGISELNGRESLTWADLKISPSGYADDAGLITRMNADNNYLLGDKYTWDAGPNSSGGALNFDGQAQALNRTASTTDQPALWSKP
ncbi:MAG: prepilin-type N-terminal cleavage/methylation domain-containing protein [Desulfobacterales bacterium]|nr:MAG: prepilin-type N-terminal cleavage/methylation domain-containing protein [Desulfobacterales bacterium]